MEQQQQGLGGDLGASILHFSIGFWGRGAPQAGGWPYICRGGASRSPGHPLTEVPNEQQKGARRERMC